MGDVCGEIWAALCGVCCICCSSSLSAFCMQKSCGAGDGCCTSCCKRKFGEEEFLKEELRLRQEEETIRKEREQSGFTNNDGAGSGEPRRSTQDGAARQAQPEEKAAMQVPSRLSRELVKEI